VCRPVIVGHAIEDQAMEKERYNAPAVDVLSLLSVNSGHPAVDEVFSPRERMSGRAAK
jgi:hypothetical protein